MLEKTNLTIRGGGGFGDALYVHMITRYLIQNGKKVTVCSDFPEIFQYLDCLVVPHRKVDVDIVAHYTERKYSTDGTKQFDDVCIRAGLDQSDVEYALKWRKKPIHNKPYIVVESYREPMGRTDGFASELLPNRLVYQEIINRLSSFYKIVLIGRGNLKDRFDNIDFDMTNELSVTSTINIVAHAEAVFGYCSYLVPLAESFNVPAFFLWSKAGLKSQKQFISSITPEKILSKPTSHFMIDNEDYGALDEFCRQYLSARVL